MHERDHNRRIQLILQCRQIRNNDEMLIIVLSDFSNSFEYMMQLHWQFLIYINNISHAQVCHSSTVESIESFEFWNW